MADNARRLPVIIAGDNQTAQAAGDARKQIKGVADEVRRVNDEAGGAANGGLRTFLDSMKEGFGRNSLLTLGLKSLSFSGPLIGVKLLAEELGNLAGTTRTFMRDLTGLNTLWETGTERIQRETKAYEDHKKQVAEVMRLEQEFAEFRLHLNFQGATIGLGNEDKQIANAGENRRIALAKIDADIDKEAQANGGHYDPEPFDQAKKKVEENYQKEIREIRNEAIRKRDDDEQASDRKLAEMQSKAREDRLKAQGKDLDAEIEQLRDKLRQENDSIEDARKKQLRDHPESAGRINANADAQRSLAAGSESDAEKAARQKALDKESAEEDEHLRAHEEDLKQAKEQKDRADDEHRSHQERVERALHEIRLDRIRALAEGGNHLNEVESKKLAIVEEANNRYRELQRLIDDPNTSADQKSKLRGAQLETRQSEFFDLKGIGRSREEHHQYAATNLNSHLTGVGNGVRTKDEAVDQRKQQTQKLNDIHKVMAAIHDLMKNAEVIV